MTKLGAAVSAAVVVGALGAAASPASAATHTVETFAFSTPAQGQLTAVCGYPVAMDLAGTWNTITFSDADGDVVEQRRNFRFTATFSANGVSITGRSRGPEVVEYHPDGTSTVTVMGVVSRQIPGQGTVMQHAGRTVLELDANGDQVGDAVFDAGQFDDPSEVCTAFE